MPGYEGFGGGEGKRRAAGVEEKGNPRLIRGQARFRQRTSRPRAKVTPSSFDCHASLASPGSFASFASFDSFRLERA